MQKDIDFEFELHAYVDGDLDEDAMARVEAYLRENPDTAAKARDYLQQKDDLRGFARQKMPGDGPPAMYDLAERLAKRLKPSHLFGWRRALVMSALFIAGWIGHIAYVPLVDGPAFANELVQAHILTSGDPSEVLPISQERMSKLFARIGELERLPDLRRFGFDAIGAQLMPSDEGAVLHVLYRDPANRTVSYFLLHDSDEAEIPLNVLHRDGITTAYWQHEHSRYALAAPISDDQIADIATFLDTPDNLFR